MHKALSRYCRMHNIAMPEKADCELIVEQCRGDLRWAIAQVQLCWSSQVGSERILVDDIRDASFDMCRAIGKIFYNKRRQDGKPKDSIWSIVSSVDESAEKWIGYLIQNCYQFYTDIGDLSELLYTLCEAHEIANWYSSWLDREMAQQCAQMVAGEAARHYNRRPSHRGFQPIQ